MLTLPYYIAEGDTTNDTKIEKNFEEIQNKLNTEPISITSFSDDDAPNSTLYFSTTQNKLVWKDNGGTVHVLY